MGVSRRDWEGHLVSSKHHQTEGGVAPEMGSWEGNHVGGEALGFNFEHVEFEGPLRHLRISPSLNPCVQSYLGKTPSPL